MGSAEEQGLEAGIFTHPFCNLLALMPQSAWHSGWVGTGWTIRAVVIVLALDVFKYQ